MCDKIKMIIIQLADMYYISQYKYIYIDMYYHVMVVELHKQNYYKQKKRRHLLYKMVSKQTETILSQ